MNAPFAPPLHEIRAALDVAKEKLAVAMAEIKPLHDDVVAIQEKLFKAIEETARQSYKNQNKLDGDLTLITDAGKIKASISKTVKWDSAKLKAIASTMSWEKASGLFKIDFSVPEANYKSAQSLDPELAQKLQDARTVTRGDLKFTIIE